MKGREAQEPHPVVLGRMGALVVRLARDGTDVAAAQHLRAAVFSRGTADRDGFDEACDHVLVEAPGGEVVATCRLLPQTGAAGSAAQSYVATEYDVGALYGRHRALRFLELGRSCVAEAWRTRRVMQLLWHGTWAYVVQGGFDVMLGCASLPGTRPEADLLRFLHGQARAPEGWRVRALPGRGVAMNLDGAPPPPREALRRLPPLVKGYLRLGAWVGENAVVDRDFGTTDVLMVLRRDVIAKRYLDHFGAEASRYAA